MLINNAQVQSHCDEELLVNPLYLEDGVELLIGANEEPMLFDQHNGKYIRLSKVGLEIFNLMDGANTGHDIIKKLERDYAKYSNFPEIVHVFFSSLRKADVLNIKPLPEHQVKRVMRRAADKPMLRLPLAKSLNKTTDALLHIYHSIPAMLQKITLYVLFFCALSSFILLNVTTGWQIVWTSVNWILLACVIIFHLIVHEMAHALVTKAYGVNIREAGVALLYYFIPVAYVDRTDTYRLKSKKSRIHIALAGPYSDLLASGLWAGIAMLAPQGTVSETAQLISFMQICFVLSNLNLLLPTDGYHAVEAAAGELSLRKRALTYLLHVMTFKKLPAYLNNMAKKRKAVYVTYSLVSLTYFFCLLSAFLFLIRNVFGNMG
ncbi:cyclic nucleotide-binding protein [Bacillus atrophaeus]|uniref:PqqD family peptide modification chaperone n=1 Tax=Bacillus atrophaeus TaxID=1452 RepID=UPI000D0703B3|nr:PqqD family peptide modification chaperone [Bacillus atrophaeus]PSA90877.1 cyclic nucleotide-binding protein [Bacillus atrophaeus]